MALLASVPDFEQQGGLYWPPYRRYEFFQARIDQLRGRFTPAGQKLAIWGCGYGYLVDDAVAAGYDAYGFDASSYAINKGKALLPGIASRLFVRDALVSSDVNASKADAGIRGQRKFDLLVGEDFFTCLSDSEIATALPLLRNVCSVNLLHMVWPLDLTTTRDARLNWKTVDAWRALLCPPDLVYDAVTNRVWNSLGEV